MTRYCTFIIAALLLTWPIGVSDAQEASASADDQAQVTEAVRSMFAAMAAGDIAKFREVIAPNFYAYDVGKRFTGDALIDLIKKAHAAGDVYVWTVTEPEVHISGEIAWITYVNRGSVSGKSGKHDVTWLESAVLEKEKGKWRIRFLHSTRVPPEKSEGP